MAVRDSRPWRPSLFGLPILNARRARSPPKSDRAAATSVAFCDAPRRLCQIGTCAPPWFVPFCHCSIGFVPNWHNITAVPGQRRSMRPAFFSSCEVRRFPTVAAHVLRDVALERFSVVPARDRMVTARLVTPGARNTSCAHASWIGETPLSSPAAGVQSERGRLNGGRPWPKDWALGVRATYPAGQSATFPPNRPGTFS